mgnify:CR=1 FL=1
METAWPGLVTAFGLCLALFFVRKTIRRSIQKAPRWIWLCLVLAVMVRLWLVPSLSLHIYDGHEADYWDIFLHNRTPNRGGTVLYPVMQSGWWGLRYILPHHPWIPILAMTGVGSIGVVLLGSTIGRWSEPWVGWIASALVVFHPIHAAWSSSAYNVIVPSTLGILALWAVTISAEEESVVWPWIAGLALTLAIACRLDAVLWVVPVVGVWLVQGIGWARFRQVIGPFLVAGALAGLAAWPLVFPGELPGAGERGVSFRVNVPLLEFYGGFGSPLGLFVVAIGTGLAAVRWPRHTGVLVVYAICVHLVFSGFDDFGDRHGLMAMPFFVWVCAAGPASLFERGPRYAKVVSGILLAVTFGLEANEMRNMRNTFYGDEEEFKRTLSDSPNGGLPRWSLDDLWTTEDGDWCEVVGEDHRLLASRPSGLDARVVSHFNVLRAEEAMKLRGDGGCLRWCMDVQDWRWSSRGVRDRAYRVLSLYETQSIAVVDDEASGYICLVKSVGARTRQ